MWRKRLQQDLAAEQSSMNKRGLSAPAANISTGSIGSPPFPSFDFLKPAILKRQMQDDSPSPADYAIASFARYGPLLPRLIQTDSLEAPLVATTLQRDTLQIGGNAGMLSIGALPAGLKTSQLTWVPVRGYSQDEGGLPPPTLSPAEVPTVSPLAISTCSPGLGLPSGMGDRGGRCLF